MFARILRPPRSGSFFLLGPRGTGKSSWVRTALPDASYVDIVDSEIYTQLLASPRRLEQFLPPARRGHWVIVDEVQKVPALLDEAHRLIESERLRFALTGSSARKLRGAGVNLLAGRAISLSMFPLTARELGSHFDLRHAVRFGTMPGSFDDVDPAKFLKAYVQTYLREEVLQEGLTRSLPAFSRFMEAAAFSQAAVLNVSAVAQECAVPRKTVENYLEVLEDLLIAIRLPPFTRRAKRKAVAHPKFFYFDVGVFRALRPKGPLDSAEELDGAALETLVFQEIRALNSYLDLDYRLHYWRTDTQLEVDFVLYGEKGLRAFEVKRSHILRPQDLTGLEAFRDEYPMAKCFLLYGGNRTLRQKNITIVPLVEFFGDPVRFLA